MSCTTTLTKTEAHTPTSTPCPVRSLDKPGHTEGRTRHQDPLLSTLRDVGGCLALILMGVPRPRALPHGAGRPQVRLP